MTFKNSKISGTLDIRMNLLKLTIRKTNFKDIIVAKNATIATVDIFDIDGTLEIGKNGLNNSEQNTTSTIIPSERNRTEPHPPFYIPSISDSGEMRIHYGLLATIIGGLVIAFVIFHVSYRRCKKTRTPQEMNQKQNQQEIEGPDYYESVDLLRNYHADTVRARGNPSIRDVTYAEYAEPVYATVD